MEERDLTIVQWLTAHGQNRISLLRQHQDGRVNPIQKPEFGISYRFEQNEPASSQGSKNFTLQCPACTVLTSSLFLSFFFQLSETAHAHVNDPSQIRKEFFHKVFAGNIHCSTGENKGNHTFIRT